MATKITYSEPLNYFPKELRKKYKIGEYADSGKKKTKASRKRKK